MMPPPLTLTLTRAGLVLAALVIAGELLAGGDTVNLPTPPAPIAPSAPPQAGKSPGDEAALSARILARPIFTKGRRPPTVPVAPLTEEANAAAAAPATPPPRLTGILIAGPRKSALFASLPGQRPIAAREGESIAGGYTVIDITAGTVRVQTPPAREGESDVVTLVPTRDDALASPMGQIPAIPPQPPAPSPASSTPTAAPHASPFQPLQSLPRHDLAQPPAR